MPEQPKKTPLPTIAQVPPELRELKRWVCWRAVFDESKGKFRKPPHSPVTGEAIGAVEKWSDHWTSFEEAVAGCEKWGLDNVGFVFLQADGFVGVDFDSCRDSGTGVIQVVAQSWLRWFPTFQEVSPSGTGVHAIGKGRLERALTAQRLGEEGCTVEVYSTSRFFTFSGDILPGAPLEAKDVQPGIEKLLVHVGRASSTGESGEERAMTALTARRLHKENLAQFSRLTRPEDPQNDMLNSVAFFAARAFLAGALVGTEEAVKEEIRKVAESTKHCPSIGPTLESGWGSGAKKGPLKIMEDGYPERTAAIEELNAKYFVVENYGNKCRVAWTEQDKQFSARHLALGNTSFANFKDVYSHMLVETGVGAHGEAKFASKAEAWLRSPSRRQFRQVVFLPGQDAPQDAMNLWQGFAFVPKKGDCSLWLGHVRENICRGNDAHYRWLMGWMATAVRSPGESGQVAVVVRGKKGVGKNVFAEGFNALWGQHGIVLNSEEQVTGNFNAHLRSICSLVADEAFFAGSHSQERVLKGLVTGETLSIEAKGVDRIMVPNLLHIIIIGNDDWLVRASGDERRFFVLECGPGRRGDTRFFGTVKEQLKDGGHQALLWHLLNEVSLAGFDTRRAPHTDVLREQMAASTYGLDAAWIDCLETGTLPGQHQKDGSVWLRPEEFADWASKKRREWKGFRVHEVRRLWGATCLGFQTSQPMLGGRRERVWSIPPLKEARAAWEKAKFAHTWPDPEGSWERPADEDYGF